jgi:hypothetical protein
VGVKLVGVFVQISSSISRRTNRADIPNRYAEVIAQYQAGLSFHITLEREGSMTKFQVVKTVSYDLSAEVEIEEANTAEEALAILEREGDSWIEYEQSDGNDEAIEVFGIEEA